MDFWDIYDHHYLRVRKFILAVVKDEWAADDLCQETFVRVQNGLNGLKDPDKISPWIFSIAYNLCRDHFRKLKTSRATQSTDLKGIEIRQESSIQKELEQREMGECVQDRMSLLPESQRMVIILFDIMGCTHQEIAEIMGITIETVKVRLHRARKKLKAILERACNFETDERNVLICEPKSAPKK
jgi:RNA polymerase sigma-70 factor (ECF subfamily)